MCSIFPSSLDRASSSLFYESTVTSFLSPIQILDCSLIYCLFLLLEIVPPVQIQCNKGVCMWERERKRRESEFGRERSFENSDLNTLLKFSSVLQLESATFYHWLPFQSPVRWDLEEWEGDKVPMDYPIQLNKSCQIFRNYLKIKILKNKLLYITLFFLESSNTFFK